MATPLHSVTLPHRTGVSTADLAKPTPPTDGINVAKYDKVAVITSITTGSGTYSLKILGSTKGSATNEYRVLYPADISGLSEGVNVEVDVTRVEYLYVMVPAITGVTLSIEVAMGGTL